MEERLVSPQKQPEDEQGLNAPINLRPNSLADFVGQKQVCENLKVFIEAAKKRGEALDHVLLFGPPGLGKTTLASIVAKELGVGFRATSAPMISKSGDLAAILTNLERNDVLFIDEIHRLNPAIEEVLYSAMEDFQLDLIIGEGPSARSVRIDLQPFTLVGATTRSGMLSTPLRERFGIPLRLDFYSPEELEKIVTRGANLLGMPLSKEGAMEIAKRSRGTPRVAGRLLRRVRDFGAVADLYFHFFITEKRNFKDSDIGWNNNRISAIHIGGHPSGSSLHDHCSTDQRGARLVGDASSDRFLRSRRYFPGYLPGNRNDQYTLPFHTVFIGQIFE